MESFKFKYEEAEKERISLSEELKSLQAQLKKANDQLKSKEQQLVSKEKTYNQLKKSLEAEKKAREQKNKEAGKLSSEIGDLRKENDRLQKQNKQYEREISQSRANKDDALRFLEERLQNQFRSESSLQLESYRQRIAELEDENQRFSALLADYSELRKNADSLSEEKELLNKQVALYIQRFEEQEKTHRRELKKLLEDRPTQLISNSEAKNIEPDQKDTELDEFEEFGDFLVNIGRNEPKPL